MTGITRRRALLLAGTSLGLWPGMVAADATQGAFRFEIYKAKAGGFSWRLKAGNNQIVATAGESYTTKAACKKGVELVQRGAGTAQVVELG